ncbi:hypothetical protein PMZ80_000957 [Knufia obscura]|uniref:MGS207 protein n=2 Tax=Knufia TaxID=430999 RepID=A0AAN8EA15_9EURO|nr:hypothetical protein PMZ80_000957 [Knufia obscura]KAK5950249.1 hypothetical protein OHC33_008717 [Knufia fluminis]
MFSSFFSGGGPKFGFGRTSTAGAIDIPSVEVHDVETSTDKRDRRLKHLLKLNHANFSILWNNLRFHNHTPHLLGSAYLLDGSADHLTDIYEHAAKEGHEDWKDSPGEIALHDYRDFLGKREYQRAWVDFFEDQLVDHSYDWKQVAARFLFERGKKNEPNTYPMFSCLTAGLGHPLIHLGYAYELSSREVGMEALGLVATCYDPKLAALLEANSSTIPNNSTANTSTYSTSNLFEVFARVQSDKRLDSHFTKLGNDNLSRLLSDSSLTKILVEHFNAWKIPDPKAAFEQSQRLATTLLISTSPEKPIYGHGYDFFLLHVLTTSHAVRIILPFLPAEHHIVLLREWLLITLALYIAQLRPTVSVQQVKDYDLNGKTWNDLFMLALEGEHKFDEHYVKGIRAMKAAAVVWGDKDQFFEKAAGKFALEFEEWQGFSQEAAEHVKKDAQGRKRRGSLGEL